MPLPPLPAGAVGATLAPSIPILHQLIEAICTSDFTALRRWGWSEQAALRGMAPSASRHGAGCMLRGSVAGAERRWAVSVR